MTEVATVAGWMVASILAWAALAKVRDPRRTAEGFRLLGIPAPRAVAYAVPSAELLAAGLLIVAPVMGAALSLALLVAFTAFLIVQLRAGATVACGCFGAARSEPITYAALVRNALLAVAAGLAGAASPLTPPSLEAILLVGTAGAVGAVVVALAEVHATTGRLWDNRLETGPEGLA